MNWPGRWIWCWWRALPSRAKSWRRWNAIFCGSAAGPDRRPMTSSRKQKAESRTEPAAGLGWEPNECGTTNFDFADSRLSGGHFARVGGFFWPGGAVSLHALLLPVRPRVHPPARRPGGRGVGSPETWPLSSVGAWGDDPVPAPHNLTPNLNLNPLERRLGFGLGLGLGRLGLRLRLGSSRLARLGIGSNSKIPPGHGS